MFTGSKQEHGPVLHCVLGLRCHFAFESRAHLAAAKGASNIWRYVGVAPQTERQLQIVNRPHAKTKTSAAEKVIVHPGATISTSVAPDKLSGKSAAKNGNRSNTLYCAEANCPENFPAKIKSRSARTF